MYVKGCGSRPSGLSKPPGLASSMTAIVPFANNAAKTHNAADSHFAEEKYAIKPPIAVQIAILTAAALKFITLVLPSQLVATSLADCIQVTRAVKAAPTALEAHLGSEADSTNGVFMPTMVKLGRPFARCTSTLTGRASMPARARLRRTARLIGFLLQTMRSRHIIDGSRSSLAKEQRCGNGPVQPAVTRCIARRTLFVPIMTATTMWSASVLVACQNLARLIKHRLFRSRSCSTLLSGLA